MFVAKKSMYYNPFSGDRKYINLGKCFSDELISIEKKLFYSSSINVLLSWNDFCRPVYYSGNNLFSLGRINSC